MRFLAPFKYLFVMGILWWSLIASAAIVPAIIGAYTLWTYINVDKRKQIGASFLIDVLGVISGRKSVPGWVRTERENRRGRLVWRGFWMPVFLAIPLLAAFAGLVFALGSQGDEAIAWIITSVPFILAYTGYRIAKAPKQGWGGRRIATKDIVLHGEVVSGEIV